MTQSKVHFLISLNYLQSIYTFLSFKDICKVCAISRWSEIRQVVR